MPSFPIGFNHNYTIGELSMTLAQPTQRKCQDDYIITWNGIHQFSDIHLFNDISQNINNIQAMNDFLGYFKNSPFIMMTQDCINVNITSQQDVIDYVNALPLNDTLKVCLASMIFRCDIDNINYPCPRYNGCVRHYVQILLVFGYQFNLINWKFSKLSNCNVTNQIISNIGYPGNSYNISNEDFRTLYRTLFQNNQL